MTGVPSSTLRGYEQAGLLLPRRTDGGHRTYSDSDVEQIRRIAHLRQLDNLNAAAIRKVLGPQAEADRAAPSADNAGLGRRLRAVRQSKRLSLKEAAQRAGLSISFLSTVERGQSGISVGSLVQLATAYETSVARLTSRGRRSAISSDPAIDPGSRRMADGSRWRTWSRRVARSRSSGSRWSPVVTASRPMRTAAKRCCSSSKVPSTSGSKRASTTVWRPATHCTCAARAHTAGAT